MPKHKVNGQCRLCLSTKALVESHIVPNFFFREMKGEENVFFILPSDPSKPELRRQGAPKEPLFCAKCDNESLSAYEQYLAKLLFHFHPPGKAIGPFFVIDGYDYKRLKNGLLSILWRMHLSKDRYFSNVNLGSKHAERLRTVLASDMEIPEEEFPILIAVPLIDGQLLGHCMLQPDFTRANGNRVYRCIIAGLIFTFYVGSAPLDSTTKQLILRRNQWPWLRAKVNELPMLRDALTKLAHASRLRKVQN